MKSKLVILSFVLAGAASTALAQTKEKYYSESWRNNFYISVGAGVQGTANPDTKFGQSITPLINLSVGKNITPIWGVRGQIYGYKAQQKTAYPFFGTSDRVKRTENYVGLNLDGILNLTNLICGYKPGRVFEGTLFVGPSMNYTRNYGSWNLGFNEDGSLNPSTSSPAGHKNRALLGASVGLGAKFFVSNSVSIDLEARGQVTSATLGAYSSGKTDGYAYLSAGVTYIFGGRKFVTCNDNNIDALNDEINRYRAELEAAKKNVRVEKETVVEEVVKDRNLAGPLAVFFKIGKANIDDYGKVNIKLVAEAINANPDVKYSVAGYCDEATGTSKFNQTLSEKRAKAVYEALIAAGVDANRLECKGFGGTNNMFGKNFLNRVVLVEAIK
jgi:outer membrane protein OmpA-like peptidoglycan-associated protein